MSGTPPPEVREALRREVGSACPVPMGGERCGNPFLRWHHFDPPWHVRQHYVPDGMVSLCRQHHEQAEAGRFDVGQLRELKQAGREPGGAARRGLEWMRRPALAVVGGYFYYETRVPLQIGPQPVVAVRRDELGTLLLDVNMPSRTGEPRVRIDRNDWIETGLPMALECPPGARSFTARYAGGDVIAVELAEVANEAALLRRYADSAPPGQLARHLEGLDYPLVTLEVTLEIADVVDVRPRGMRVAGGDAITAGGFAAHAAVGLQL